MLRLTSTQEYALLRQSSFKVIGKYFIIVYIQDSLLVEAVAGITVSRKVGNAVTRNFVKRRVKAFLRDYLLPQGSPIFKCNIIALPSVISADWLSICKDLEICFQRILKSLKKDSS